MGDRKSLFHLRCDGGCGWVDVSDSPQEHRCPNCDFGMLVVCEPETVDPA